MRVKFFGLLAGLIVLAQIASAQYTDLVDPFTGVDGGNTFVGSCRPFSMVRLGPNTVGPTGTHGYNSSKNIIGFSHTHLSGTGGEGRYGNIQVIPAVGKTGWANVNYVKRNEYAAPGLYQVDMGRKEGDVTVELTSTAKAGLHKYTFFTWDKRKELDAHLMLNVSHVISRNANNPKGSRCQSTSMRVLSDTSMEGTATFSGGWGGDNAYTVYFYAVTNLRATETGIWQDSIVSPGYKAYANRVKGGGYFNFKLAQQGEVLLKVGISFKSVAQARQNAYTISGWDFERVRNEADKEWNDWLSKIEVTGGSLEQRKLFYTSLYHTLIMPTDMTGEDPKASPGVPSYWEHYALWDVFRSVMPLHTLVYPEKQREKLQGLLDIYKRTGWLPDAWVAGGFAQVQGGTNADVVFADAIVKELGGFDEDKALEAMLKNARVQSDSSFLYGREANWYNKLGYLPAHIKCGSSRSLEYAYNDYATSAALRKKGRTEEANKQLAQSLRIFGLFNDSTGFFWAKDTLGNWVPDFAPDFGPAHSWEGPYFYEGNPWLYSTYAPHAMDRLIQGHGGADGFKNFLDQMHNEGHFSLGNEPSFLTPYAYNYAGYHYRTAERVRDVLEKEFRMGRKGWPGQDDSGALSSWYVFSAMGFFPVAGQDVYLIGSPLFSKVVIHLERGKKFVVEAKSVGHHEKYVSSARLNGRKLNASWFSHDKIKKGGKLKLDMSADITDWYKTAAVPPSYN